MIDDDKKPEFTEAELKYRADFDKLNNQVDELLQQENRKILRQRGINTLRANGLSEKLINILDCNDEDRFTDQLNRLTKRR